MSKASQPKTRPAFQIRVRKERRKPVLAQLVAELAPGQTGSSRFKGIATAADLNPATLTTVFGGQANLAPKKTDKLQAALDAKIEEAERAAGMLGTTDSAASVAEPLATAADDAGQDGDGDALRRRAALVRERIEAIDLSLLRHPHKGIEAEVDRRWEEFQASRQKRSKPDPDGDGEANPEVLDSEEKAAGGALVDPRVIQNPFVTGPGEAAPTFVQIASASGGVGLVIGAGQKVTLESGADGGVNISIPGQKPAEDEEEQ